MNFRIKHFRSSKDIEWPEVATESVQVPNESWYFDATISKKGFSPISLPTSIKESILRSVKEGQLDVAEKLFKMYPDLLVIRSLTKPLNVTFVGPTNVFIHNDKPMSMVIKDSQNSFIIIAENKDDCEKTIEEFHNSFVELSNTTKRFGYQLESFLSGSAVAKTWINLNPLVKEVIERKSKNELERKVINSLNHITGTFVSNVEVIFGKPAESFEYDIVLVLGENNVVVIEVKDYKNALAEIKKKKGKSHIFNDNMKSYLILRTVDKAVRLSPNVQILLLLRGFPNDTLTKMNEIAKTRGILIMSDYQLEVKLARLISYAIAQLMHKSKEDFYKSLEEFLSFKFNDTGHHF